MSGWAALVLLKRAGSRKTRMAAHFTARERDQLCEAMANHVLAAAMGSSSVSTVTLLSETAPSIRNVGWRQDSGRGLNAEIRAAIAQSGDAPIVILPADLPGLTPLDIDELIEAAGDGTAIAPDLSGQGTNGLALRRPMSFAFSFGERSFAKHLRAASPHAKTVRRRGFELDIDNLRDLERAVTDGTLRKDELEAILNCDRGVRGR